MLFFEARFILLPHSDSFKDDGVFDGIIKGFSICNSITRIWER